MRRKFVQFLLVLFIPFSGVFSQDFHYSQFYNEPLNFNPSFAGGFKGDKRIILSLRDQYRSVKVPYFTVSGNFDMKYKPNKPSKSLFSGGVVFNYDIQGDSKISLLNFNLAGSYKYFINTKHVVSVGALLGYSNRGFSMDDLRWDNNYDPVTGKYNGGLPSGESFEGYRFSYLETGVGLSYDYVIGNRSNIKIGVSAFHLNRPSMNFYDSSKDKLDMRLSLIGLANIKIIDALDFQPSVLFQKQGVYRELVLGGLFKVYLSKKRGRKLALQIGLIGRLGEGIAPKLAVEYNAWYVGFNYDIVTKDNLSEYTNYRGGPEIHLRYIISSVRPLNDFKICPIY